MYTLSFYRLFSFTTMKLLLILTFTLLTRFSALAQSGTWRYATPVKDINGVMDVATGPDGNIFFTGRFMGSLQLGTTLLTSKSTGWCLYIAKCKPNGKVLHVTTLEDALDGLPYQITVDKAGNSYVTGTYRGTLTYRSGRSVTTITTISKDNPSGNTNIFLVKCTASGKVAWVRQAGSADPVEPSSPSVRGLAVDQAGNSYIAGPSSPVKFQFGPNLTVTGGRYQGFVASYDRTGRCRWGRVFTPLPGGLGTSGAGGVGVDNTGNCYVIGSSDRGWTLDGITLRVPQSTNYLARLDSRQGKVIWALATPGDRGGQVIGLDKTGDIYIAGYFTGTVALTKKVSLTSAGDADGFVARYDPNGEVDWATALGGSGYDLVSDIAVDPKSRKVFVAGTGNFTSLGTNQAFLAQLGSEGQVQYQEKVRGTGTSSGFQLAIDEHNTIYIIGVFTGSCTFGKLSLNTQFTQGYFGCYQISGPRTTGRDESKPIALAVDVYPNPAQNQFTLRLSKQVQAGQATLYNHLGRAVLSHAFQPGAELAAVNFDTATLPDGLYVLRLVNPKATTTRQVVVRH